MAICYDLDVLLFCTLVLSLASVTCENPVRRELTASKDNTSSYDMWNGIRSHGQGNTADAMSSDAEHKYSVERHKTTFGDVLSGVIPEYYNSSQGPYINAGNLSNGQVISDQTQASRSQAADVEGSHYYARILPSTEGRATDPALRSNNTGLQDLKTNRSRYRVTRREFDSTDKHPRIMRTLYTLTFNPDTSCVADFSIAQFAIMRYNMTRKDPVVLKFRIRSDSEFALKKCTLLLIAPNDTSISVLLTDMSGGAMNFIHLTDSIYYDDQRASWKPVMRRVNPGDDWLSKGNTAFVRLQFAGGGMIVARLNAMVVRRQAAGTVQTRYLTPTLGYIQNAGLRLECCNYFGGDLLDMNTWTHLAVPEENVVLVSVVFAGLGSLPTVKVCQHRLELYEGNKNRTVWRLCSRYHSVPQPHLSYHGDVHVHYVTAWNRDKLAQGIGFRLIFTIHHKTSVPTQQPMGEWNCSSPTWLAFSQHFICDLVVQCGGREDEAECAHYTQCGRNGVRWLDKCYWLHRLDPGSTWHRANAVCSRMGPAGRLTAEGKRNDNVLLAVRLDLAVKTGHATVLGITASNVEPHLYLDQRSDTTIVYGSFYRYPVTFLKDVMYMICLHPRNCDFIIWHRLRDTCSKYACVAMCEANANSTNDTGGWARPKHTVTLPNTTNSNELLPVPFPYVICDQGQVTHAFLASDHQARCFREPTYDEEALCTSVRGWNRSTCDGIVTSLPVPFPCGNGAQRVHYTLLCDHRQDCYDNSDEDFCFFPPCDPVSHFQCTTRKECHPLNATCDFQPDCVDASDEEDCSSFALKTMPTERTAVIIDLVGQHGWPKYTKVENTTHPYCPHTHYLCPSDGNCLPVFTRCNGVGDCRRKEDELGCDDYVCPGLYRCRGRDICVLPLDLCDGVLHCPQHDDERFCRLPCPDHCACLGHAFVCRQPFEGRRIRQLRYLDAQDTGMKLEQLTENLMLIYLNLARCNIRRFINVTLPNLRTVDLSDNSITVMSSLHLVSMPSVQDLKLSGNPLTSLFEAPSSGDVGQQSGLQTLDLSRVKLKTLSLSVFVAFSNLKVLNLSKSGVEIIHESTAHVSLPRTLRELDMRDCDLTKFPRTLFQGVDNLQLVYADTFKLCCPAVLPAEFIVDNCHAPSDEISSCDALLRSTFYRSCLSVLAACGLLGNTVSFLVRLFVKKSNSRSGFGVFVQHLCMSDFLMGIYLVIIGVADRLYMTNYLWQDTSWRHSAACKMAGFVSMTSCEVSSFIICLITVDRFLVLRFPFSQLRFRFTSAQIASVAAWMTGGALAVVPLLPAAKTWQFYSQTGICIPLPVTRQDFAGRGYAFGVMIVLNFILFIMIAVGQLSIYASIQSSKMGDKETSNKSHDAAIARRLITVVVSDFFCWFPVGMLGLLASSGTPVPGEVNVAMAIFILPLNSALNPFLYTLNMLEERLRKRKEEKMLNALMQQTND